ncbi:MAG TPA: alpha/beta hydrolase [Burkholderiales bacterium]|nr:alpha/beta hydrolase [Burkholderiales bacterium]
MFDHQDGLSSAIGRAFAVLIACLITACAQTGSVQQPEQVTYVQNGAARLRVFVEGSGPAIVLLPQQGRGPRDFDDISKRLVSAGYRVVRPEPRGFGESVGPVEGVTLRDNARDVAAAIEKVGAAPAIVVGWAYGNRVARMIASERPELVRGVVLIAAGGKYPPKPEVLAKMRIYQDKSLPLETRAEAARVRYGTKTKVSVADMRLDEVSEATVKAQSLAPTVPLEAWWNGGKAPMLVLQGLEDVIAPPENGRSLRRDHPDRVTLVEFEDLGHYMAHERPDLVVDAIVNWTKKLR